MNNDLSTADTLRLLSTPQPIAEEGTIEWDRRRFLRTVAYGLGAAAATTAVDSVGLVNLLPNQLRDAWGVTPVGRNEGILVNVVLYGGNDGANTLVPYTNRDYYAQRGALAVPAAKVRKLNTTVGLAPQLPYIHSLYNAGQMAIVQGVGYANPNFSHFSSMAQWMRGDVRPGSPTTGWIGRWLDGLGTYDIFKAATIGETVPLHMNGQTRRAVGIAAQAGGFGTDTTAVERRLYAGLREFSKAASGRGRLQDLTAATIRTQLDVAATSAPIFRGAALPEVEAVRKMTLAARLINANLGLRVVDLGWGDFDTHDGQPKMHNDRLLEFDAGVKAFYTALAPAWRNRVTMIVWSEFGRTAWRNGSNGTDHGAANNIYLFGNGVKGGLLGRQPTLTGLQRWQSPNATVDFRSVFATVLDSWLGGGGTAVTGTNGRVANLFDAAPKP